MYSLISPQTQSHHWRCVSCESVHLYMFWSLDDLLFCATSYLTIPQISFNGYQLAIHWRDSARDVTFFLYDSIHHKLLWWAKTFHLPAPRGSSNHFHSHSTKTWHCRQGTTNSFKVLYNIQWQHSIVVLLQGPGVLACLSLSNIVWFLIGPGMAYIPFDGLFEWNLISPSPILSSMD